MREPSYYKIQTHLESIGDDADESVDFIIYSHDEFLISRSGAPADAKKGFAELPPVDLTFSIESAIKLRDFLNFALPPENEK